MAPDELIQYVIERTHYKARQVVRRNPALGEAEDVQQDLILDLLGRLHRFDGDRAGMRTFICRLIDHRIATMLQRCEAKSRSALVTSLDETRGDAPCPQAVDASQARAHRGLSARDPQERRELEMDAEAIFALLSPELQTLCLKLRQSTPAAVARDLGASRAWLYRRIAALRAIFQAASMDQYL